MSTESTEEITKPADNLALVYGSLLARLWLAMRAIQTGIEKYSVSLSSGDKVVPVDGVPNQEGLTAIASSKAYGLSHYHGIPEGLLGKFQAEPLMAKWALPLYDKVLGPSLILLGLAILLGLGYRTSLFLLGLLYISLTWGLILINQNDGVAWLGTHMILIIAALGLARYNRFAILKKW